jgi:RimJ/RimL family protein N-acetyltransferase
MTMRLRKLESKDVSGILEWMKDENINCFFRFDAGNVSEDTVASFIQSAQDTSENLHLAIVNAEDEYLGTISLKEINHTARNAEYAISTRACVHGTGAAFQATLEILRIAFEELHLHRVYLNVLEENSRANRFYQKCGFRFEGQFRDHLCLRGELKNLNWYALLATDYYDAKNG